MPSSSSARANWVGSFRPASCSAIVQGRRGVVLEDRVAVVVELQREAVVPEHLAQEEEVAVGVLVLAEEGGNDFAGGVVDGAEDGGWGLVWAEPVVEAAVYLQEHSFLKPTIAAAAMTW